MKSNNHQYICIEGNLGAGKTSLCEKISRESNCELILEQFSDNPFLPLFYENPERFALTVELFFMTERYKQLQAHASQKQLFKDFILSDYIFQKTFLFANHNLSAEEMRLFRNLFNILQQTAPIPDLLVYIDRPIDQLLQNIKKRNRSYELKISADYLLRVQNAYIDFLNTDLPYPRIVIRLEDKDFLDNEINYNTIISIIEESKPVGLHIVEI